MYIHTYIDMSVHSTDTLTNHSDQAIRNTPPQAEVPGSVPDATLRNFKRTVEGLGFRA